MNKMLEALTIGITVVAVITVVSAIFGNLNMIAISGIITAGLYLIYVGLVARAISKGLKNAKRDEKPTSS